MDKRKYDSLGNPIENSTDTVRYSFTGNPIVPHESEIRELEARPPTTTSTQTTEKSQPRRKLNNNGILIMLMGAVLAILGIFSIVIMLVALATIGGGFFFLFVPETSKVRRSLTGEALQRGNFVNGNNAVSTMLEVGGVLGIVGGLISMTVVGFFGLLTLGLGFAMIVIGEAFKKDIMRIRAAIVELQRRKADS